MISFWQGEREFFEARITGDSPADLVAAVQHMVDKCRLWNGDDTALTWSIENEAVVLRFPGASSSSGWDGK